MLLYCNENLALQVITIFVDPEGGLVNCDMIYNSTGIKLVSVYAPQTETRQTEFFKRLVSLSDIENYETY